MPKYSFKNNLFLQYGGSQHTTPADPGLPKHNPALVLAMTQCVGHTTHNFSHTMHHVDPLTQP